MIRAGGGKGLGLRRRIIAIDRRARHIALGETHHLAAFQVDGGEDDQRHHGVQSRNRVRKAWP